MLKKTLLFTAIFSVVYGFCLHYSHRRDAHEISVYSQSDKLARIKQGGRSDQTLIIGGSRSNAMNLDPAFAETHQIYNLSLSNVGGMHSFPHLLETYLKHNPPPHWIVFCPTPLFLTDAWDIFDGNDALGNQELYRASRFYSMGDLVRAPVFRENPGTAARLMFQKLNINGLDQKARFKFDPSLYHPETGFLIYAREGRWHFDPKSHMVTLPYAPTEKALAFADRFFAIAAAHDIKVIIYHMPIPTSVLKHRVRSGFYKRYFETLDRFSADYPETVRLFPNMPHLHEGYFLDGSHLNQTGAERYNRTDFRDLIAWLEHEMENHAASMTGDLDWDGDTDGIPDDRETLWATDPKRADNDVLKRRVLFEAQLQRDLFGREATPETTDSPSFSQSEAASEFLEAYNTIKPEADMLSRLYLVMFGDYPGDELVYWLTKRQEGMSQASICERWLATRFERDMDAETLVHRAYRQGFGREPDAAGLAFWVDWLRKDGTNAGFLLQMAASGEWDQPYHQKRLFISHLYALLLRRAPHDPGGMRYHIESLKAGEEAAKVVQFLTSDEYGRRFIE